MSDNLSYLYGLTRDGIKLGLTVSREFSDYLGNPERKFKSIHIAGTNGKGSVSAFIYNILSQKYRAGLYTSPHLLKFNERIVVNKEMITDEEINDFVSKTRDFIESMRLKQKRPTFFEATTLMAFDLFEMKNVEYAAVEVGLGGRLDSTNIVTPEVSVITQIGYEHYDRLGCSIDSIAFEKGGIIKKGKPAVVLESKPEAVKVLRRICDLRDSRYISVETNSKITDLESNLNGTSFTLTTPNEKYDIETRLIGQFQARNIATAVLALENSGADRLKKADIERGILSTKWPGRMNIIRRDPMVMVDAAHNPPAADALQIALNKLTPLKPLLVVGMLSDKDQYSYLRALRRLSDRIIFTTPNEPSRSLPAQTLSNISNGVFEHSEVIPDPIEAYRKAREVSDFVLVTGSIYLISEIIEYENKGKIEYFQKA